MIGHPCVMPVGVSMSHLSLLSQIVLQSRFITAALRGAIPLLSLVYINQSVMSNFNAKAIREQLKQRKVPLSVLSVLCGYTSDPSHINSMLRSGRLSAAVKENLTKLGVTY